ncbi:hypothetical protein [Streptomyces sp. GQFP]|uniref:hypothetical protein n=1 Tax=Streptomyces sp. GQFP TaxID=2907545 RepID=UPI001F249629|nr:hypothetical protein [Streptomyces sp. GQFP]UIX30766.1 hypothetical protein LUX31_12400 [Streptomyces sp. GQFP]
MRSDVETMRDKELCVRLQEVVSRLDLWEYEPEMLVAEADEQRSLVASLITLWRVPELGRTGSAAGTEPVLSTSRGISSGI